MRRPGFRIGKPAAGGAGDVAPVVQNVLHDRRPEYSHTPQPSGSMNNFDRRASLTAALGF